MPKHFRHDAWTMQARSDKRVDALDRLQVDLLASIYMQLNVLKN